MWGFLYISLFVFALLFMYAMTVCIAVITAGIVYTIAIIIITLDKKSTFWLMIYIQKSIKGKC